MVIRYGISRLDLQHALIHPFGLRYLSDRDVRDRLLEMLGENFECV